MTYRCIRVKHANELKLKHNSLLAKIEEREVSIPLEDIAIILIEDNECSLTGKLIASLSSYYIGLIICDDKHMPSSITLPLHMHYKQLKVFNLQMDVSKPVKSQLWQQIIQVKIKNQIAALKMTTNDQYYIERISELLKEIKSNDKTNREAIAAKYFFTGIYGTMFTRKRKSEDEINAALNYGYTIIMAAIARMLAMYGFNTILGIHHESYMNNYNLACDLMEPFRPLVDICVYENIDNLSYPLPSDIRQALIEVLVQKVKINNKTYLVEHAIEEMVLSYISVIESNDSTKIQLPQIVEITICEDIDEDEL